MLAIPLFIVAKGTRNSLWLLTKMKEKARLPVGREGKGLWGVKG